MQVNDNFYGQVELDKTAVAQLDAAKALEMALDMKLLKNRLSRKDITNFRLHKLESFGAFIDIFTEDGVIGKPDRRKKPSKS